MGEPWKFRKFQANVLICSVILCFRSLFYFWNREIHDVVSVQCGTRVPGPSGATISVRWKQLMETINPSAQEMGTAIGHVADARLIYFLINRPKKWTLLTYSQHPLIESHP